MQFEPYGVTDPVISHRYLRKIISSLRVSAIYPVQKSFLDLKTLMTMQNQLRLGDAFRHDGDTRTTGAWTRGLSVVHQAPFLS